VPDSPKGIVIGHGIRCLGVNHGLADAQYALFFKVRVQTWRVDRRLVERERPWDRARWSVIGVRAEDSRDALLDTLGLLVRPIEAEPEFRHCFFASHANPTRLGEQIGRTLRPADRPRGDELSGVTAARAPRDLTGLWVAPSSVSLMETVLDRLLAAGISEDRAGWLYRSNGGPASTEQLI